MKITSSKTPTSRIKLTSTKPGKLDEVLTTLAQDVIEACPVLGLMIKENTTRGTPQYIHAPITLFPTPYPLDMYKKALGYQQPMGEVVAGIVRDPEKNIHELLRDFSAKDEFMQKLLQISRAFNDQRARGEPAQTIQMCVLRADYMIDQPTHTLKLVEYNVIASSFGCLSNKVHHVHEYVHSKYGDDLKYNYDFPGDYYSSVIRKDKELNALHWHHPDSRFEAQISQSFVHALTLYKRSMKYGDAAKNIWVLFMCEDDERNLCDQKMIEVELMVKHGVRSMRRTLVELQQQSEFNTKTKVLRVDGKEIGFVYYRTCYQQEHYQSKNKSGTYHWDPKKIEMRKILECSMAIKCPSVDVHLAGFKKYQQSFSDEQLLQRVTKSKETVNQVKQLFKGIWSLENLGQAGAEVNRVVDDAIKNPRNYVLKPQKEGGGNNFFDAELKQNLIDAKKNDMNHHVLGTYLVMERINPPMIPALMVRNGQLIKVESLSEFGYYSSVFVDSADNKKLMAGIPKNRTLGSLMRTKASHNNEGGVNAGFAVIDSPFIVQSDVFKQEKIKSCINFK